MKTRRHSLKTMLAALLLGCAFAGATWAGAPPDPRYAENLRRWRSLTEEQRQAIREKARQITPEQMAELRNRLERFRQLDEKSRQRLRGNFHHFQGLPPGARRALRRRFEHFRNLPEDKRTELRRRFMERRRGRGINGGPGDPKGRGTRPKWVPPPLRDGKDQPKGRWVPPWRRPGRATPPARAPKGDEQPKPDEGNAKDKPDRK